MKHLLVRAALAAALLLGWSSVAGAQTVTLPQVNNAGGAKVGTVGAVLLNADGTALTGAIDLATRLEQEGEWQTLYGDTTVTATTANQASVTLATSPLLTVASRVYGLPSVGRMMWVENVLLGFQGIPAGTVVRWQFAGLGDSSQYYGQFISRGVAVNGQQITIPIRQFWRPRRIAQSGLVVASRGFIPVLTADTSIVTTLTVVGYDMTDDPNFTASKTFVFFGDSIDYGNGYGPTATTDLHTFKMRDYFKSLGYDMRLVAMARPGLTSSDIEAQRLDGRFDAIKANIGGYKLGTNDALLAAGGFVNTYETNLRTFWAWWSKRWPNTPLIVFTPPPIQNNTDEANAALIRARAAAVVSSIASPLLRICDLGNAFDRTVIANYRTASGSEVHPSTLGHAAMATAEQACIASAQVVPR